MLAVIDLGSSGFGVVMAFGAVIGVFGHIVHSRTMILTGILVIALVSAYFLGTFLVHPGQ
ncbi:MAG: hypothetical protein LC749_06680 [Actinobacteria bacterium]|nr:hypothetical protein [Actinomycetota bacterium]